MTSEEIQQLKQEVLRELPQALLKDAEFTSALEGTLSERFPRRDEFARLRDDLQAFRQETAERFGQIERRFEQVDQRFAQIDQRFEQIDQRFAQIDQRFEQIDRRFAQIDRRFEEIDRRFAQIDQRFEQIDQRFAQIDQRFEEIDQRFAQIDQRFEQIDRRFAQIDRRFEEIDRRFEEIDRRFEAIDRRFEAIEQRLDKLEQRVGKIDGRTLEIQFRDKASAYLGRVLRGVRVLSAGDLAEELEGVLTEEEWQDLLSLDVLLRGRANLGGQRVDVLAAVEVSVTISEDDVARAARRAALLRKKGWKTLAVAAGEDAAGEVIEMAARLGVAVLEDGKQFNWPEALAAA